MPHQCVRCSKLIQAGSKEIIEGCSQCGGHFFFYIRDEKLDEIKENPPIELTDNEKVRIEKEIRDMAGIVKEDAPVILDIEAVRVTGPAKYEIDLVNLFQQNRPLIYKVEEGKYIIDLSSTLSKSVKGLQAIKDPDEE